MRQPEYETGPDNGRDTVYKKRFQVKGLITSPDRTPSPPAPTNLADLLRAPFVGMSASRGPIRAREGILYRLENLVQVQNHRSLRST